MLAYLRGSGDMTSFDTAYDLVKKNPNNYKELPFTWRCSPTIASLAIKKKPKLFGMLPECLQEDEKFVYDTIFDATIKVNQAALVLKYIPRHYVESRVFMKKCTCVEPQCVVFAGKNLKSDFNFMFELVERDGRLLQFASPIIKNNKNIVLIAVSDRHPISIKYASLQLRDDIQIGEIVVRKRGTLIRFLSDRLRSDLDIAKLAVSNTWEAFQYICEDIKIHHEICEILLYNAPHKYDIIPSCVGSDEIFISKVVSFCPEIVKYVCECGYIYSCHLKKYKDNFVSKCILQNPQCYNYFCRTVKNNVQYCMQAVKLDPTVIWRVRLECVLNDEDVMYEVLCKHKKLWCYVGRHLRACYGDNVELFLLQYQSRYIK